MIVEGCLGDQPGRSLNIGDTQYGYFRPGEKPFYDDVSTELDITEDEMSEKQKDKRRKQIQDELRAQEIRNAKGGITTHPPVDTRMFVSGYCGKAKGWMQLLYERGLYKDGMINEHTDAELKKMMLEEKKLPDVSMYGDYILSQCTDYLTETTALEAIVESRGHIVIVGVACHPEFAGEGVEYAFGMSKRHFRRHNNCVTKDLEINVRNSFSSAAVPFECVCKFGRRTREYMRMYLDLHERNVPVEEMTYNMLEKSMKDRKSTHRNILEIEREFLKDCESDVNV